MSTSGPTKMPRKPYSSVSRKPAIIRAGKSGSASSPLNKISDSFHIRSAFLRSVNVALDYADPASSRDYVITGFIREVFTRLAPALAFNSSTRAWRITGDYGTGKSAFALSFARLAAGKKEDLPSALHPFLPKGLRLEPVLVSGSPQPLEQSIKQGLSEMRRRIFGSSQKFLEHSIPGQQGLLDSISQHIAVLKKQQVADGIVLILDELGQNLHHAALHPSHGDISLLQALGERADRSGSNPFVIVALLHQGFSTYSGDLDHVAKREWEKVAGRFKEVVFAQPLEQVAALVAEMLGLQPGAVPRQLTVTAEEDVKIAAAEGLYGAAPSETFLREVAPRLYPLHPTVFPLLVLLLRRFGQNERSLVGFLSSHEPHGFREFAEQNRFDAGFYRLSHLYDFFKTNLAASLSNGQATHWAVIEATVNHARDLDEPTVSLLKTIGLFNLVNDPAVVATETVVRAAVGSPGIDACLKKLRGASAIIHEQGDAKGFTLWPHSSVNLHLALDQAEEALANEPITTRNVAAYLDPRSIVARRHYIETGNLRHFAVQYLDWNTFRECLATKFPATANADGQILVVLTQDDHERTTALAAIKTAKDKLGTMCLVGVTSPVINAADTVRDYKRWEWIRMNVRDLAGDAYARNHIARESKRCRHRLERELHHLVNLRNDEERGATIQWFDQDGPVKASGTKGILPYLSTQCHKVFELCPKVPNELINRRVTSSAATRARSTLIEAIATQASKADLAFDPEKSPPEFSIYLSVLKQGKVHVKSGSSWRFQNLPELKKDDPLRLAPALARIHELLVAADTNRCTVPQLYDALRAAPYGARDGFIPLLLAIYLAGQWDQTAIFEDGTFLDKPGAGVFQRLTKEPEAFALQHCSVRGVRRELFQRVADSLGFPLEQKPDVLQIVRPLMRFSGKLPEYSLYSERHLSLQARRARAELLKARDPAALLFRELPKALGFEPFNPNADKSKAKDAEKFAEILGDAFVELQAYYDQLIKRLSQAILDSFNYRGSVADFRVQFAARVQAVEQALVDSQLKLFARYLADPALAERAWIESVGAILAKKAPERWRDADEEEFHHRLGALSSQFVRTEGVGFNGKAIDPERIGRVVCLTLTRPDGREVRQVVHWPAKEDSAVAKAKEELRRRIEELGPAGMAAAAQFVWEKFEAKKK